MKSYLKIGEMAELCHVSTQALRLYANDHLLEPEYLDPKTGYRYYTLEQCARLDFIQALKSCEMRLNEIRDLFSVADADQLADSLLAQSQKLNDRIHQMSISRNNLSRIEKNLRMLNSLPPFGIPYFEYMEQRQIDVQKTPFDFFSQGLSGYEKMVRHMQNYMYDNHLPPSYFVNIGTMIRKEDYEQMRFRSDSAFIFTDSLYPAVDTARILPRGLYMSIVADQVDLEENYAKTLRSEIEKQNMQVSGDYLCEVLSQYPFTDSGRLYFKIQVPVRRKQNHGV
jgi:DNA-binding transcriptional MerR regulator